jgi:hypothetical protein
MYSSENIQSMGSVDHCEKTAKRCVTWSDDINEAPKTHLAVSIPLHKNLKVPPLLDLAIMCNFPLIM